MILNQEQMHRPLIEGFNQICSLSNCTISMILNQEQLRRPQIVGFQQPQR